MKMDAVERKDREDFYRVHYVYSPYQLSGVTFGSKSDRHQWLTKKWLSLLLQQRCTSLLVVYVTNTTKSHMHICWSKSDSPFLVSIGGGHFCYVLVAVTFAMYWWRSLLLCISDLCDAVVGVMRFEPGTFRWQGASLSC
jgi:hypothetical protein